MTELKPLKHPNGDLFVCDITDVILKDDLASIEHPFYSLSKKPDREARRYERNGNWIEFRPSIKGLPTIYDKDLIIYAISQLIAGINTGRRPSKTVSIDPYAYLTFTQRGTGGRDYDTLVDSLDRLDGTRFRTNVLFDGTRKDEWIGLIDRAALETDEKTGKPKRLEITLSDMVMNAVIKMDVLTLHRDYFRLGRPIERRVYELARKHCGQKLSWMCNLSTLHVKSGSKGSLREFRRKMKPIIAGDFLPDYMLLYDSEADQITFVNRNTMPMSKPKTNIEAEAILARLDPDIDERARLLVSGWDMAHVRKSFASWWYEIGKPQTMNPDAFFLKFCRTFRENNGAPH